MALITAQMRTDVAGLYAALFGRAPESDGLGYWVDQYASGRTLDQIAQSMYDTAPARATYPLYLTNQEIVTKFYQNVLGTTDSDGIAYWTAKLNAGESKGQLIAELMTAVVGYSGTDAAALARQATFNNKVSVGLYYAVTLGGNDVSVASTLLTNVDSTAASVTTAENLAASGVGKTYQLTTGIDAVVAGSANDTIQASTTAGALALTAFDTVDGGAGTDTLNLTSVGNLDTTTVSNFTVKNVEIANITASGTVTTDTSAWSGLTKLVVASVGGETVTAPSTATVTGSDSNLGAGAIAINGGTDVTVTAAKVSTGTVTIGGTTAATGNVSVSTTTTAAAAGAITVTGGKAISVSQTAGNAVNTTSTMGAVTVNGDANTTSVSVTASKAATAGATVVGVTDNTVTITDVNYGSATKAGTITTATVSGYTTAAIGDNALTSLTLANGSGNVIIDNSGLTTPTNKTLALSVNGLTGGTLDDADIYTTLNVTTTGADSTLANITDSALTALTVAGTKVLTLTSTAGLSALKTVAVTGSAGVAGNFSGATVTSVDTSGTTGKSTVTVDATKATFTGGAGVDVVTLSAAAPTKAVSLGDGNDTLTLAGGTTAVTGAIAGGNGTDTLSMAAADAAIASGSATFAGLVTGFEQLTLTSATNQTIDLAVLGNYNYVTTSGGNGLTLSNMSSGGTLVLNGAGTAYTVSNTAFTTGTSDVLNLTLTDGSGAGVAFASTGITASGVETVAITTADTQTTPSGTFNDSVTLLGNSAKTITVAGNAGLTLTATDTAATTVDASGITTGGFTFTSGALAAAATIKGSAAGTNTVDFSAATKAVTYTGGTGADVIAVTNSQNNVITLGDGANTVNNAAAAGNGNNTVTGGKDADVVKLGTGNNVVSLGDGANTFIAGSGNNTYTGGSGVDTITLGGGKNTVTTGTGADVVTFTAVVANGNSYTTITDPHSGLKITFTDAGQSSGTSTFTSAAVSLADTAVFQDYLDAAVAGDGSTNSIVRWFQYNGNTYIVEDNSVASTFQNAGDTVVKLTGLVDLSTATFAAVATTSTSLTLA